MSFFDPVPPRQPAKPEQSASHFPGSTGATDKPKGLSEKRLAALDVPTNRKHHLKELSPMHKQAMSLLAQGVPRGTIGEICNFSPDYVTWLANDPLCKQYIREMNSLVDMQIESMYGKVAEVISDAMSAGTMDERLKGARLQLEVTGRLGKVERPNDQTQTVDRLANLAERLTGLLAEKRAGLTINGEVTNTYTEESQFLPSKDDEFGCGVTQDVPLPEDDISLALFRGNPSSSHDRDE